MPASLAKALIDVEADTTKVKQQISSAIEDGAKSAGGGKIQAPDIDTSKAKKSLDGLRQTVLTVGAAVLGAKFFSGVISESEEAAKTTAQVNAVLKSTGGVAGVTAADVDNLANSLSKKTGVDDEIIARGAAVALTFTNIRNEAGKGNDIFNQTVTLANDMSAALGTDMQSAVLQLGKALNDPIRGMSQLQRVGVSFTKSQRDQVKALVDSGNQLGAQKVILAEVRKEFGGTAEATATGLDKARVSFANFEESVGKAAAPLLDLASSGLSKVTDAFSQLPTGVQQGALAIGGIGATALIAGPKLADMAKTAKTAIDAFRDGGAVRTFVSNLGEIGPGALAAGSALGILTVGIGEVGAIFADYGRKSQEASQRGDAFAKSVVESGKSVKDAFQNDILRDIVEKNGRIFDGMRVNLDELETAALKGGKAWRDYKNDAIAGSEFRTSPDIAAGFFRKIDQAMSDGKKSAERLKKTNAELGASEDNAGGSAERNAAKQKAQAEALAAVEDKANAAKSALEGYYGMQTSVLQGTLGVKDATDKLGQGLFKNTITLDANTSAGRENLNNLIGYKDAALKAAEATGQQTGSAGKARAAMLSYSAGLASTLTQAGFTKQQVQLLQQQLGLTPKQIATAFSTPGLFKADGDTRNFNNRVNGVPKSHNTDFRTSGIPTSSSAIRGFLGWTDRVPRSKTTNVSANVNSGSLASFLGLVNNIPSHKTITVDAIVSGAAVQALFHRAVGGSVSAGNAYMVGERGPEVFQPSQSGTVYQSPMAAANANARQARSLTVKVPVYLDGRKVAEMVGPHLDDLDRIYS